MDSLPGHVLDKILNNLSIMDLFRLQVVSRSFNNSCKSCLSNRTRLSVTKDVNLFIIDKEERFTSDQCWMERLKLGSQKDMIPPKLFKYYHVRILSMMSNLKDLLMHDFWPCIKNLGSGSDPSPTLDLRGCPDLEFLEVDAYPFPFKEVLLSNPSKLKVFKHALFENHVL